MSSVRFTALSGCREDGSAPRCFVLELDGIRIMLDAGCDPSTMDCTSIETYVRKHKIDAVLLSHGDVLHVGALPLVAGLVDEGCAIFTTTPIQHLGRLALVDARAGWKERHGTAPACLESSKSIDRAFDRIKALRYSQPMPIGTNKDSTSSGWLPGTASPAHDTITVMAMPAGHSLGGAMWRIRKTAGGEDIIYAVDFDHRRGACLDGAAFDLLVRPTCLIADCRQALVVNELRRERDAALFSTLKSLLVKNNTVIIPVESGCCSIELLYMFEKWWAENKPPASLYFMTQASPQRTIDLMKGLLEWMGPGMMRAFDQNRENPFDLTHVKVANRLGDLASNGPKVVLASSPDITSGFSLQLLLHYATSSHCHVLLLDQPAHGTVAADLVSSNDSLSIVVAESRSLEGNELIRHRKEQQAKKEQKQAEAAFAKMQAKMSSKLLSGGADSEVDSDSDSDGENDENDVKLDKDDTGLADPRKHDIASARALTEVCWSDYKTDWWCDLQQPLPALDPFALPKLRFQVFTFKESRLHTTDYGQAVPTDMFKQVDSYQAAEEDLVAQARLLIKRDQEGEQEDADGIEPVKWVPVKRKLQTKCHKKVIPGFNGLSDGKSIRNIIGQVAPRRLILVGGSAESTDYLYNHYLYSSTTAGLSQVLAPRNLDPCELSSSTATLPASLTEALTESIRVIKCLDYQVAHVLGQLSTATSGANPDTTSTAATISPPAHKQPMSPVLIGDIRIGEFRRLLMDSLLDHSVEFHKGDLVICGPLPQDGQVVLRKVDDAEWCLEGPPSALFDSVKDLFYQQLAVI